MLVRSRDEVLFPIDLITKCCVDSDETVNDVHKCIEWKRCARADSDKTVNAVRKCIEGQEAEEIKLPPSFVMFEYEIMKFFERKMKEARKVVVVISRMFRNR